MTPANQFQSAVVSVAGVTLWLCEDDRELKSVDCSHWRALISVYPCESVMSDTVQHVRSSSVKHSEVYIYMDGAACTLQPYVFSTKSIYQCVLSHCTTGEFLKERIQSQMNPRLSLVFLAVHLTQTLRPPGLIWPKLVRRSKAQRNQDCIQWEHCPNPLLPSPL